MKKLSKNIKFHAIIIIVVLEALAILLCMYLYHYNTGWERLELDETVGLDTSDYIYSIEITPGYRAYSIEGFCYRLGEDVGIIDTSVVLYDKLEQKYYRIQTDYVARPDVTEAINDGFLYDNAGFIAEVRNGMLAEKERYRILLLCIRNGEEVLLETDYYL